jgi:nucleoside 2-deoxyribosyltransferase/DNA-directed RNA polymerase subunit RPC12/RpoP
MTSQKCKICNSEVTVFGLQNNVDAWGIRCPLCGDYKITGSAFMSDFPIEVSDYDKALFSGYLRNFSNRDNLIMINSDMLKKTRELTEPYKSLSMDERIDLIISFLAKNTEQLGNPVVLHNTYPIFYLRNADELTNIINWIEKMNLGKSYEEGFILEVEGWRRYDRIKEININSKKAFIAMSFSDSLDPIYSEAIEPACSDCGFKAIRVDLVEHNEKICDKIIAEIRTCRFIIIDFTMQKQNVYFEAGYAQGIGLPVIWACKKGEEDKLHFDTRQYNHIIWGDARDLKEKLVNRIKATVR